MNTYHSVCRCSFGKTSCETINLGRIVLVCPHQSSPGFSIDFHWCFTVDDVSHSTGSPQLVVTRDPVVASTLDVPRDQVSRTTVRVGVFEKCVPYCVADEQVKFWSSLIGKTNHLVLPLVAKNKREPIPRVRPVSTEKMKDKISRCPNCTHSKKWSFNSHGTSPSKES